MTVERDDSAGSRGDRVRVKIRVKHRRRRSPMTRLRRRALRRTRRQLRRLSRAGRSVFLTLIGRPLRSHRELQIPYEIDHLPSPTRVLIARINWRFLAFCLLLFAFVVGGMAGGYRLYRRHAADKALMAGETAWKAGAWEEASRQWRIYLEKHPDDLDILLRYAKAKLEIRPQTAREVGAALGAYWRYLQVKPGDAAVSARLCQLYASVRNHKQAADVARHRLAVAPDDVVAAAALARALVAQDNRDEAYKFLVQFAKDHPAEVEPYTILSDIALQGDSQDARSEARAWLDQAVANNPSSAEALARRARFYQKVESNPQAARAELEAAERLNPVDLKSLLLLAEGWFDVGELGRASDKLEAVRRFERDLPPDGEVDLRNLILGINVAEGNLLLRQGRKDEGVRLADRALQKLEGVRREAFIPLGVDLYLAAGRVDSARRLVDEYRTSVQGRSKPDESALHQLALLEAGLAGAENQPYRVINLIEPLVVGKPVGALVVGGTENVQVWRLLARAFAVTGQDRRALEALDRYVKRRPNDAEAVLELGLAYYRRGEFARAQELVAAVERMRPDNLEAKLLGIRASVRQASRASTQPYFSAKSSELLTLRDSNPANVEIRILIAKMAVVEGRSNDAIAELLRAVRECDKALPAWLELAEIQDGQGHRQQAVETCQTAIARFPQTASPRLLCADIQSRMGGKEGRGTLEEAVKTLTGSEQIAARFALAGYLLKHNRRPQGLQWLQAIAAEFPDNERCRFELLRQPEIQADSPRAQALIDDLRRIEGEWGLRWQHLQAEHWLRQTDWRERSPKIVQCLQKCIENDPSWPEPVVTLGRLYEQSGRPDKAEEVYGRYFTNNPRPTEVLIRLFDLLERQHRYVSAGKLLDRVSDRLPFIGTLRIKAAIGRGDYEAAIRDLRERIGADPDDAVARVVLARLVYHRQRDTELALGLLDDARSINPNLLMGTATRVAILCDQKRRDEARAFLDSEVKRREDFDSYAVRAQFFAESGRNDLAESDYRRLTTFKDSAAAGYQRLGEFLWKANQRAQAIAAWEEGLRLQPDDMQLGQALIKALVGSDELARRQRGQQLLDEYVSRFPREPGLLSLKAALLLGDDRPEAVQEAVQLLERVVELNPRDIVAHLHLLEQARQWGDPTGERKLTDRALGANPENPALLSAKAGLERRLGNVRVSWQLALSAIRLDPENVSARVLLVYLGLRTGRYEEAQKYGREALDLDPSNEEVNLVYALALAARDRRKEAISQLELYRKSHPDLPSLRVLLLLADLYRFEGDVDAAEVRVAEAEAVDPAQSIVFTARLRCLATRKKYEEVLARFRERRSSRPSEPQVALAVASIMAYAGEDRYLREAETLYQDVIRTNPDELTSYLGLGQVAYQLGEVDLALRAYRQAVKLDPYHQQALNNLAWLLAVATDKLDEAFELAEKGVLRYPDDPNLYDTRGTILLKKHQPAPAKADFQRALKMLNGPSSARAKGLLNLGRVCLELKDFPAAVQSLSEAVRIDKSMAVFSANERVELEQLLRSARESASASPPVPPPVSSRSATAE